jgi:NAD(P)-dependent dehydrogenase (short-subunit alcohol dehydrogenase family)
MPEYTERMQTKKVALVTGANKGLGFEIARQLGQQGFLVVLAARDAAKAETASATLCAENLHVRALKLDVTNADDIAQLPAFFEKEFGRLDVLVNNAGVNEPEGEPRIGSLRQTFETNVFGVFAITEALTPLLKAAPAGRIVNQSSILGSLTLISDGQGGAWTKPAYTASKAALNMLK